VGCDFAIGNDGWLSYPLPCMSMFSLCYASVFSTEVEVLTDTISDRFEPMVDGVLLLISFSEAFPSCHRTLPSISRIDFILESFPRSFLSFHPLFFANQFEFAMALGGSLTCNGGPLLGLFILPLVTLAIYLPSLESLDNFLCSFLHSFACLVTAIPRFFAHFDSTFIHTTQHDTGAGHFRGMGLSRNEWHINHSTLCFVAHDTFSAPLKPHFFLSFPRAGGCRECDDLILDVDPY
jgi:hypothetical protein